MTQSIKSPDQYSMFVPWGWIMKDVVDCGRLGLWSCLPPAVSCDNVGWTWWRNGGCGGMDAEDYERAAGRCCEGTGGREGVVVWLEGGGCRGAPGGVEGL